MLMTIAALYAGKKILDHATKNTAAAAGAAASAAVLGAAITAGNKKKIKDYNYSDDYTDDYSDDYQDNYTNNMNHVETKIIEKVQVPVLVTQKCISCRAYVTGYTDEIIKCEYCDTEQNVSKDNEEKN